MRRRAWLLSAAAGTLLGVWPCLSAAHEGAPAAPEPNALKSESAPKGRPTIKLDALEFPDEVGGTDHYRRHLKHTLAREARRADWGAGRGSRIEYRFFVRELSVEHDGDVLRVKCVAVGALPGGKTATSRLSFGGHPKARHELAQKVLDIVARGVITRLAELERERRRR